MKKVKIFAVSDLHGCTRDLKRALKMVDFRPNSEKHLLVVCGDPFDRGTENLEMYAYLRSIKNKLLIKGNHEEMLVNALQRGYIDHTDVHNGTDVTIEQLLGGGSLDPYGRITVPSSAKQEIYSFVNTMYDYLETDKHVFVHGWTAEAVSHSENWRRAPMADWQEARWKEWQRMYPSHPKVKGKTVVCGHRSAALGSMFDTNRPGNSFLPFFGDGITVIDGSTYKTGIVNVYITEDELPENNTFEESLTEAEYTKAANGKTTVLIRLRDERSLTMHQGDTLTFTCSDSKNSPSLTAIVTGVYDYPDIDTLRRSHKAETYGMPSVKKEIESTLNERLGSQNIKALGLTAIRFSVM